MRACRLVLFRFPGTVHGPPPASSEVLIDLLRQLIDAMLLQTALSRGPLLLGLAGLDVGVDLHKIIRVSVGRDNFHTWGGSDAPEENIAYAAANLFADSAREFAACLEGDDDIDLV